MTGITLYLDICRYTNYLSKIRLNQGVPVLLPTPGYTCVCVCNNSQSKGADLSEILYVGRIRSKENATHFL